MCPLGCKQIPTMQRFAWLLACSVTLTSACAKESSMDMRCELTMAQTLASTQPAELTFGLVNAGQQGIQVLSWQTPFEGIRAPLFTIKRDGEAVEYRGIMVKRGSPRKEDYLPFAAGERRNTKLDLAEGWDVSMPGAYTVEYSAQLFDVVPAAATVPSAPGRFHTVVPKCNTVSFVRMR
jgi:hypothetical protein